MDIRKLKLVRLNKGIEFEGKSVPKLRMGSLQLPVGSGHLPTGN